MTYALARRGPDGRGVWGGPGIALGHTRLSIIDSTDAAAQPMMDRSGRIVISFNGEIYNYLELREELRSFGHTFRSNSDTEVLLCAFIQWGVDAFPKMVGMWAVAIYDCVTRRLILSRDRFGIKPLYFRHTPSGLAFASTIRSVLCFDGSTPSINPAVARSYLLEQAVDEGRQTFVEGVYSLGQGCFTVVDLDSVGDQVREQTYWEAKTFIRNTTASDISFEDACDAFREKLTCAVRLHTRSDVEVASCLSGGLDSSSIVSLLATIPEGRTIRRVFSAVFPGEIYDEEEFSRRVAEQFALDYSSIKPSTQSFLSDIDDVVCAQEQPFGSTGVYVQWKVFQAIGGQHVKVVLDGQGADEYLGGYLSFLFPYALESLLDCEPRKAFRAIRSYVAGNKLRHHPLQRLSGLIERLFGVRSGAIRSPFSAHLSEYLKRPGTGGGEDKNGTDALAGPGLKKTLTRYLTRHSLPSLLRYEDMNSMWFSVEARVPFLDHRLVEFALSLPSEYLVDGVWTKRVLRGAMRGIVPADVIGRRDKIGFGNPEERWVEALISSGRFRDMLHGSAASELLNVSCVETAIQQREQRKLDPNYLWRVYSLLAWQRQMLRGIDQPSMGR